MATFVPPLRDYAVPDLVRPFALLHIHPIPLASFPFISSRYERQQSSSSTPSCYLADDLNPGILAEEQDLEPELIDAVGQVYRLVEYDQDLLTSLSNHFERENRELVLATIKKAMEVAEVNFSSIQQRNTT
jgi:hypothetical protein